MSLFSPALRAVATHPVVVGLRAALIANSAVMTQVWAGGAAPIRIYPDLDAATGPFPFITISVPSAVADNDYSSSRIDGLFDVTAADRNPGTGNVAVLEAAIPAAILDAAWTIAGYTLNAKALAGIRPYAEIDSGVVYRYVACSFRILAERVQ